MFNKKLKKQIKVLEAKVDALENFFDIHFIKETDNIFDEVWGQYQSRGKRCLVDLLEDVKQNNGKSKKGKSEISF
jgi:hypothetical protein